MNLTRFSTVAQDWLLPPYCVGCRRPWFEWFCNDCRAEMRLIQQPYCRRCGLPLQGSGAICRACARNPLPPTLTMIRSVAIYSSGLARAIRALKYGLASEVAATLGDLLADRVMAEDLHDHLLVPVPLHADKLRERGFNQSELLCDPICRRTGFTVAADVLMRAHKTLPQVGLDAAERYANVRNAFSATVRLDGHAVLLIDDVCTTGATLGECSRALDAAGAASIVAFTLAREL